MMRRTIQFEPAEYLGRGPPSGQGKADISVASGSGTRAARLSADFTRIRLLRDRLKAALFLRSLRLFHGPWECLKSCFRLIRPCLTHLPQRILGLT